jgi:hypothetical protein
MALGLSTDVSDLYYVAVVLQERLSRDISLSLAGPSTVMLND